MWMWLAALGAPCIDEIRDGLGGQQAWTTRSWTARGEVDFRGEGGTFEAAYDGTHYRIDLDVGGVIYSELYTSDGNFSWNDHGEWNREDPENDAFAGFLPFLPDNANCEPEGFESDGSRYSVREGRVGSVVRDSECGGVVETTYGDWREVDGGWVPHRRRILAGESVFLDFRVKEWTEGADATSFEAPSRPDHSVSEDPIPLEVVDNRLVVTVFIEGPNGVVEGRFLFDTGYTTTTLSPETARSLGLDVTGSSKVKGVTGDAMVGHATLPTMRLGETVLSKRQVSVHQVPVGLHGVIGQSTLDNLVVHLSYNPPKFRLAPAPQTGSGAEMVKKCGLRLVDVELPGGSQRKFAIDSGAYTTVVFTPKGEARAWAESAGPARQTAVTGVGGSGRTVAYASRFESIMTGGHTLGATDAIFLHRPNWGVDGNLGHSTMKCFDWTLDFANDRVRMDLVGDPATCAIAQRPPSTWMGILGVFLCLGLVVLMTCGPVVFVVAAVARRRRQAAVIAAG